MRNGKFQFLIPTYLNKCHNNLLANFSAIIAYKSTQKPLYKISLISFLDARTQINDLDIGFTGVPTQFKVLKLCLWAMLMTTANRASFLTLCTPAFQNYCHNGSCMLSGLQVSKQPSHI